MEISIIKKKSYLAIGTLLKKDNCLLENDVNKRQITHKLAEYLLH